MIDLEERRSYIGASEMAAVVGLSPWGSPVTVWSSKVGLAAPEPEQSLRMWLGTRMEPILRELYYSRTGRNPRTHQRLVRADGYEFIGCHPDYVRLEVKTARSADGWGEDGAVVTPDSMAIPLHYFIQVQTQMLCTGWDQSDVAVLIGHDSFRVYSVPRDNVVIDGLLDAGVEFWESYVLPRVPPPLDGSDAAAAYLRERFPRDTEPVRIATPEEADLMMQYVQAKSAAKLADEEAARIGNMLRGQIGDAKGVTNGRYRATWSAADVTRISPEEARALLDADTLAKISHTTTTRTLRVSPVNAKD